LEILTQFHQFHFHVVREPQRRSSWCHQHWMCICATHMNISDEVTACFIAYNDWWILKLYTNILF
jgi:hypothetical protein